VCDTCAAALKEMLDDGAVTHAVGLDHRGCLFAGRITKSWIQKSVTLMDVNP